MAQTNRYPAVARDRDYRRPTRKLVPANDNLRLPKRPVPYIPANDNRPVPKPTEWALSRPPRLPGFRRWSRLFFRLYPPLAWLLTLYDLYELWRYYQEGGLWPKPSNYVHCTDPFPEARDIRAMWFAPNICSSYTPGPFTTTSRPWSPSRPWLHKMFPRATWAQSRWYTEERWFYPEDPGTPVIRPPIDPLPPPEFPDVPLIPPYDWPLVEPLRPRDPFPDRRRPRDRRLEPLRPRLPEDRVSEEPSNPREPDIPIVRLPEPPGPRVRERKWRVRDMPNQKLRRFLGWLISAASEAGDFLDALYDALPDDLRSSKDGTAEKFDKVFRNLDKVDFTEAVSNLWQNQVTDRYYGQGFGAMADALEDFGLELPSLRL